MEKFMFVIVLFLITSPLHIFAEDGDAHIYDCETFTSQTIEKLVKAFFENDLGSFDISLNLWKQKCGVSEATQRLFILSEILQGKPSQADIQKYFDEDFSFSFVRRVESSLKADYGYIYTSNKSFYGYVPLNHSIDSVSVVISSNLLGKSYLTPDERLVCTLFTGDVQLYEKMLKGKEFENTYIRKHIDLNTRKLSKESVAFCIYSGIYKPFGQRRIFGPSPMLGISLSSPLQYKLIVELGLYFRFNFDDKSFDYWAMDEMHTVNSDVSIFATLNFGYKLVHIQNVFMIPKLGIGVETVSTGLSQSRNPSTQDNKYYDVTTMHLSLGFTVLLPVFKNKFIGLGMNYHYCPYQWDKSLYTKFDTSAVSAEVSWRF